MNRLFLSESDMLPRIRMAREYDTEKFNVHKKTPLRTVRTYEISFFLTDGGIMEINGESYPVRKWSLRFNRPGDIVSSVPPYRSITVMFSFGQDDSIYYYNDILDAIPLFFETNGAQLPLLEQIISAFNSDMPGTNALQNAFLLQLIVNLYGTLNMKTNYRESVRICIDYMRSHIEDKITLELLGTLTGYSPLHVLRIFREDTKQSPHEYLCSLRMARARKLLAETDTPVSLLSAECGFSSEAYFYTVFRQVNGVTPGEYRKTALAL